MMIRGTNPTVDVDRRGHSSAANENLSSRLAVVVKNQSGRGGEFCTSDMPAFQETQLQAQSHIHSIASGAPSVVPSFRAKRALAWFVGEVSNDSD